MTGAPSMPRPAQPVPLGVTLASTATFATLRGMMAYAAAIGATEDVYLDDLRAGGIVATPGYVCALQSPLLFDAGYLDAIGVPAEKLFDLWLHASLDTWFHRPIRADMALASSLCVTDVRQIAAGALVTCRIATREAGTGALVADTWYGSLYRGHQVACSGHRQPAPPLGLRPEPADHEPAACAIATPPGLAHVYSECSGIWNPIHTERGAARDAGLPDIILHGTCTWAMACLALTRLHCGGDPQRMRRFGGRFAGMVTPVPRLLMQHAVSPNGESIAFALRRHDGKPALSHGIAHVDARSRFPAEPGPNLVPRRHPHRGDS